MTIVLQAPGVRAEIDADRGARLTSLQMCGLEVLGVADDPAVDPSIGEGCYPMVPWAGRIRDGLVERAGVTHRLPISADGHALHGTGRDATWEHRGGGTFHTTLGDPWPESGEATLTYQVREAGLRIALDWDGGEFGCSLGLHPWFRRRLEVGGPVDALLRPTTMVERGVDGLPTGRLVEPGPQPWDDCFRLAEPPVLHWPGALEMTLTSGADWWVVYDAPETMLCVEPQTAPPDVFAHPSLQPAGAWPRRLVLDIAATGLT